MKKTPLNTLTGLTDDSFAEVLSENPRAYMAVRGAVAEKHLEIILENYRQKGSIKSFRPANGDFDKDFYIQLLDGREVTLECKNVEVLNISNTDLRKKYFKYLFDNDYLNEEGFLSIYSGLNKEVFATSKNSTPEIPKAESIKQLFGVFDNAPAKVLTEYLKSLPQKLKESGIARYKFSSDMMLFNTVVDADTKSFLSQFDALPLTIDFQRTRNSTDKDGEDAKSQRFYKLGEIDAVGACLFSRTQRWEFIFALSNTFDKHKKYPDRYSNRLQIKKADWDNDLLSLF